MTTADGDFMSLSPHLVNLRNGRLAAGGLASTTAEEVDRIFEVHLPRFIAEHPGSPVPLMFWAHGGLVPERTGLAAAAHHVPWWLANGVYPVYFVWETGLLEALGTRIRSGIDRLRPAVPVEEAADKFVEWIARHAGGQAIWADLKASAARSVDHADGPSPIANDGGIGVDEGGARYVARKLAEFLRQNPGAVTLHAVGHSAGAIFHSYFLRAAFEEGVPAFESFIFLDPAILIEEFKRDIVPRIGIGNGNGNGIGALSTFALGKQRALDDECKLLNITFYNKSLLCLVHHALEDEEDAPLLGLQENVEADPILREMFGGADPRVQAIWSPQLHGPLDSRSDAREHAGIDSEPVTMESVARRITGQENIESFPGILP
ncbi:hypothetical protein [Arthrobacter crystallopoietes]|uniref:Alpha/beta hydrolase family protein n=1 Tax=Crystallibacter crystallopoietes TaxID=37928 RepID=A0A1H1H6C9_9MICC|nr:hypothetical protein [Arthrobacter crystallopoietes]AUI52119.1 hypothetical protein AC20117_16320 [Arthrobacter crystallopoietes]SDR21010.1 hypothetical protein SAMN04489742_4618 [Arthrobacter crystallopoietes]